MIITIYKAIVTDNMAYDGGKSDSAFFSTKEKAQLFVIRLVASIGQYATSKIEEYKAVCEDNRWYLLQEVKVFHTLKDKVMDKLSDTERTNLND